MKTIKAKTLIIGAGPAGAVAAGILSQNQYDDILVIERCEFPRFSIGESLLPHSMVFLEEAGLLQTVVETGFQFKNGAAFAKGDDYTTFDFRKKFTKGWGTTYQVQRAIFDNVLAMAVKNRGVDIRFLQEVTAVNLSDKPNVIVKNLVSQELYRVETEFILDASGFGRVLPRLLSLETPSDFPVRQAIFTHLEDGILAPNFDRNKILISIHPEYHDVWFWTIPFSNGRCSVGVVAQESFFDGVFGGNEQKLRNLVEQTPNLSVLLEHAKWDTPVQTIVGYSANVCGLTGQGYALLGNAGEFLDPIFSSGITIALKSASLAAHNLLRQNAGLQVNWKSDYEVPLKKGVDTFRTYVDAWYTGGFQKVIFSKNQDEAVRDMISSILAGYAWDESNPFVKESKRRFSALESLCSN